MFRQWCQQNGFMHARALSHVLMDGGVLSVPSEKAVHEMYEKMCESVLAGEEVFVVEQKTSPTYNFFMDLDYKAEKALTVEEIQAYAGTIVKKLARYGAKDCLVCVAPPKEVGGGLTKTGIHLNFPDFVVNQESALALREHALVALYTEYGGVVDWNTVVDVAVYGSLGRTKGSGFRMPWSSKREKHLTCGGAGCAGCINGRVSQMPYLPLFIYKMGPVFHMVNKVDPTPSVDILWKATVRTSREDFVKVESPTPLDRENAFGGLVVKDEVESSEAVQGLERFVQAHLPGQGNATILKVFRLKKTIIATTNSKYCENLGRGHGSNHVYFMCIGDVVYQRCHCTCETLAGRKDGFCKDFSGEHHRMPETLVKLLYENEERPASPKPPTLGGGSSEAAAPAVDESLKTDVQDFIRKRFKDHEKTCVMKITSNKGKTKHVVTTNVGQFIINGEVCGPKTGGGDQYRIPPLLYRRLKKK